MNSLFVFYMLPLYPLGNPRTFAVATLLSLVASAVAFWSITRRWIRFGWGGLVVLIVAPIGCAVMACWEIVSIGPELKGDTIRQDLAVLSPLIWFLILAQAIVLVRAYRRACRARP